MKVNVKEVTVFNFPQYSAEIDALPAQEKAKMDALAREVADSFVKGKTPIVAFFITGHADRDAHGADFEMKVSLTRAESAKSWIVNKAKAIVQQSGGKPSEVDMAEFSLNGQGASHLFTQDPNFPARTMNRRIVVKYAAVEMDPPTDIGFVPNLARATALIGMQPPNDRTRRIQCALAKLANPATDDTYFEWGSLGQIAGGTRGLSEEQVLAIARSIIHSLRRDISNNNLYGFPNAPDNIVVSNLLNWEQSVRNTKNKLVERISIEGVAAGQVHLSVARYIERNENNPNSILSCFKNT